MDDIMAAHVYVLKTPFQLWNMSLTMAQQAHIHIEPKPSLRTPNMNPMQMMQILIPKMHKL